MAAGKHGLDDLPTDLATVVAPENCSLGRGVQLTVFADTKANEA